MIPRLVVTALVATLVVGLAWPARARTTAPTTAPVTPGVASSVAPVVIDGRPATECVSANPRPDCFESGEFERSSRGHLILFGVLIAALAGIGVVVVRSTIRRDRPRAQPSTGS